MMRNDELLDVFVNRLKSLINEKGLSQKKLSEQTGIPRTTINSWIIKKQLPSMYPLYLLANYFNVSVDYFFGLTDFE